MIFEGLDETKIQMRLKGLKLAETLPAKTEIAELDAILDGCRVTPGNQCPCCYGKGGLKTRTQVLTATGEAREVMVGLMLCPECWGSGVIREIFDKIKSRFIESVDMREAA